MAQPGDLFVNSDKCALLVCVMNSSLKKNIKKLIEALKKYYAPAEFDDDTKLTTEKIFAALQQMIPSEEYTPEDVYNALLAAGFKYDIEDDDGRPMFCWKIREIK